MPWNGSGTYVRSYSWSNDASNNLPISATKFDTEDNGFATGLSLCLTKDGQSVPSQALAWSYDLTITLAADGAAFTAGRTGGSNNPTVQLKVADGSGGSVNLTTSQSLSLAIAGTNILSVSASAITGAQPVTANSFTPSSATIPSNGMYLPAANQIGMAVNSANAGTWSASGLQIAQGLEVGSPTGGFKGAGTLNATTIYQNGTALAPSATTDTTNASNISGGTLATARLSASVYRGTNGSANVTFSTSGPSGGSDGDIWFQHA